MQIYFDYWSKNQINIFRILADRTRIKILKLLIENKEICVTDIAKRAKITLSAISHQLRKLEMQKIVISYRKGQTICYSLNKNKYTRLIKKILSLKV